MVIRFLNSVKYEKGISLILVYYLLGLVLHPRSSRLTNGVQYRIMVTRITEVGMITPPVGVNVYVIKGIAKDVTMGTVFRGITPFLVADFCHVVLLIIFPSIALFLPSMMLSYEIE